MPLLREPLQRAISHWEYECTSWEHLWQSHQPVCGSALTFWEHRPDNWMTRQFCGYTCAHLPRGNLTVEELNKAKSALDEMELVLTLEYLPTPLGRRLLQNTLGWNVKHDIPHQKDNSKHVRRLNLTGLVADEDSEIHAALVESNLWDTELYQYALLKQFQAAKAAWPQDVEWTYEEELHATETHVRENMEGASFKAQLEAFNKKSESCTNPCCKEGAGNMAYIGDLCGGFHPGPAGD